MFGRRLKLKKGFNAGRAAGGDRDYRDPHCDALARSTGGRGKRRGG